MNDPAKEVRNKVNFIAEKMAVHGNKPQDNFEMGMAQVAMMGMDMMPVGMMREMVRAIGSDAEHKSKQGISLSDIPSPEELKLFDGMNTAQQCVVIALARIGMSRVSHLVITGMIKESHASN